MPNDAVLQQRAHGLRIEVIALIASAMFLVSVLALHVLRTDLQPGLHVLSEYALGATGWIMTAAFLALAAGFFATAIALRRELHGWIGKLGFLMTVLAGVGSTMGGLFPMDPVGTPVDQFSTAAKLHELAFMLGGPGSLLAATFVNLSLAKHVAWRSSQPMLLTSAASVWLATVAFGVSIGILMSDPAAADPPPVGWFNRLLVASWLVWIVALSWRSGARPELAS